MDESDNILFTTLKQAGFSLSDRIQSLSDINSDDLLSICLHVLQLFKVDTSSIRQLKTKFRFATKISQQLTKHVGTQFQLNDLMNSTNINNVRKILVTLMSKLSMLDSKASSYQSAEQRNRNEMAVRNQRLWKGWLKREWVHPAMVQFQEVGFQSHKLRYDLNQEIEKKNILRDFRSEGLKYNIQAILNDMYCQYVNTKKRQSAEEGIKINRQGNAEANLTAIKENNREDWNAYKTQGKKLNKMKKRMVEAVDTQTTKQQQRQATIFQQQVEQIISIEKVKQQSQVKNDENLEPEAKEDPMQKLKFDIDRVKKTHEKEINAMLAAVQAKEQQILNIEKTEVAMEEDAVKKEEQTVKMKTAVTTIKKEAEKKQMLLNSIEVPEELPKEVKQLTQELAMLHTEAKNEVQRIQTEIKSLQQQGSEKLTILSDMKDKLSKIQQDYVKVTRQIAEKNHQKQFITVPQGGISRNYYNKRITQMEVRWKEGRKQIDKAQQDINKTQQLINTGVSTANRIQTEIQNLLNMDKAKNDALNKLIRQQYEKYRSCFKDTIKAMNSVSDIRTQSRQYEAQAAQLLGKSYKTNVEKLKFALEDVRKERLAARNK